jgi:hypothetical protein
MILGFSDFDFVFRLQDHNSTLSSMLAVTDTLKPSLRQLQLPLPSSASAFMLLLHMCVLDNDSSGRSVGSPFSLGALLARWFASAAQARADADQKLQQAARQLLDSHMLALGLQAFRFQTPGNAPRAATFLSAPVLLATGSQILFRPRSS